mgnify:CR=1 FL=1
MSIPEPSLRTVVTGIIIAEQAEAEVNWLLLHYDVAYMGLLSNLLT